jgi:dimethylargininase
MAGAPATIYHDALVPVALTREVSSGLAACELTHLERVPIDVERARSQHHAYEEALRLAGYQVERLSATAEMADSVFIEDIALVFGEIAVVTRPGAESRRAEIPGVAEAVARYRTLHHIDPPGTIDGGDVLVVDGRVYVGQSRRTNEHATAQLHRIVSRFGYTVCAVPVRGCLHLKSAVTALSNELLLVNPEWIDKSWFQDYRFVDVDPRESMAANALRLTDRIIYPDVFPRTADRIARAGLQVELVDVSELQKAEGAVTCCSLIM